jgi:alkyl sulfatase BDS1-like metallo-beta-lactamase superfamily hydrolase
MRAADRVLELDPEWLLGSHIIPLQGKDEIRRHLTVYRDATQYLWDQSVRLINKGYTPTEMQHALAELPEHLFVPPYSVPMYGTPFTSVPEFFTGWVSWFNGDATDLFPSEPVSQAERFIDLMGGRDAVLDTAKTALTDGDFQFAAELARFVVRVDHNDKDARNVKAAALRARGYQELNPIARAWYLHGAMELEGRLDPAELQRVGMAAFATDVAAFDAIESWRYLVDADTAGADRLVVGFRVTDTGDEVAVEIRNSVLHAHDSIPADAHATVELTLDQLNAAGRAGGGFDGASIDGDSTAADRLLRLLDREPSPFYMHLK